MGSEFKLFSAAVHRRLDSIKQFGELYKVEAPNLFDQYLAAFPEGTNPIFRERTEHDCQCCKNFIRNLGSVVAISGGEIHTVWSDLGDLPLPYGHVAVAMDQAVRSSKVQSVFRTKEKKFGAEKTLDSKSPIWWNHFYGDTPTKCFVGSPGEEIGRLESVRAVLKRGLDELRQSDLDEILNLIDSNSLYRGEEHRKSVADFRSLQRQYANAADKELFAWEHVHSPAARFRNTVIGTLAVDLADGVDTERAVKSFESKVAPANYKRPTALITPRMIEQAVSALKQLDLEDSISRRFACIGDISVNDIIFVDNDVAGKTKDGLTSLLMQEVKMPTASPRATSEISIEDFIAMRSKRIELVLEERHLGNFVSITAPAIPDSKPLFKWDNGFAWAYDGDVADSIKQRVKKAGGNVNAKIRCSLAWFNHDDLDIHCLDPHGTHIYYANKCGVLDVDMNAGGKISDEPVENLSWIFPVDGRYIISVVNFNKRSDQNTGFEIELECDGALRRFSYPKPVQTVHALEFYVINGVVTEIKVGAGLVDVVERSIDKWGVKTLTPARVNMIMLSPNHWERSSKTGNRHYFFILDKCLNPEPARGIFNEFLMSSLEPHRKVFEVLGAKTKCQPSNNQLSGVGFSSTRSDSVGVMADGRPYTISF